MPKHLINRDLLVQTGLALTAEVGLDNLTLKEVAQRLKVSTPAIYKHIENLESLKSAVKLEIQKNIKNQLLASTENFDGIDLLKAMALAYVRFAKEQPKLYQAIEWSALAADTQGQPVFQEAIHKIYQICQELGASELEASHIIRTVRSLAQGYADLDSHQSFVHPSSVESSLIYAYDTFFLGVQQRFQEKKGAGK
ncbi:TetR/AcrR family transcriptional regulator [Enterococcus sp. HY326]|uniref:TetR/AcrR family transcriptional regulator n=1 Tax=Enterococcus sp. HY326 TaxID=2971265 RepID=UPI00223FB221|nr:TetR/AcrR family transcriptional regulator [Enterococcus sp. HY326]